MNPPVVFPPLRITSLAFSALVLIAASWLIFNGLQLFRFLHIYQQATTLLEDRYWTRPIFPMLAPLRKEVGSWRDVAGVRSSARLLYMRLGRATGVPLAATVGEAADVIRIDPVNGQAWTDFATANLAASRTGVALAAWDVSSVVAPREYDSMLWRMSLLGGLWREANDERKQRFFFDMHLISARGSAAQFLKAWRGVLATLTPDVVDEIEAQRKVLGSTN